MPTPIPEWDQFRVLISYLIKRQLKHEPTTLKQASQRVGLGGERIFDILEKNNVGFATRRLTEVLKNEGVQILIHKVPEFYLDALKITASQIDKSFEFFQKQEITLKPEPDRAKIRKEEREKKKKRKLRYFLVEN